MVEVLDIDILLKKVKKILIVRGINEIIKPGILERIIIKEK